MSDFDATSPPLPPTADGYTLIEAFRNQERPGQEFWWPDDHSDIEAIAAWAFNEGLRSRLPEIDRMRAVVEAAREINAWVTLALRNAPNPLWVTVSMGRLAPLRVALDALEEKG